MPAVCLLCPPWPMRWRGVEDRRRRAEHALGRERRLHRRGVGRDAGGLAGYVIIGHSERRQYFGETDESVNKKIKAALAHGLMPIVCVGEDLAQNEAGVTETLVSGQVRAAFAGISADQARGVVVAYEPIWAIGTGRTATSEVANRVCGLVVRGTLAETLRRGGGAGHPHPVRRQRQREEHRRADGDAGHRRRADRRRQPEGGRVRRDGARDRGAETRS